MAHLTLQLGGSIIMPFSAARTRRGRAKHWRLRAIREAGSPAADVERFGWGSLQVVNRQSALVLSRSAARSLRTET